MDVCFHWLRYYWTTLSSRHFYSLPNKSNHRPTTKRPSAVDQVHSGTCYSLRVVMKAFLSAFWAEGSDHKCFLQIHLNKKTNNQTKKCKYKEVSHLSALPTAMWGGSPSTWAHHKPPASFQAPNTCFLLSFPQWHHFLLSSHNNSVNKTMLHWVGW